MNKRAQRFYEDYKDTHNHKYLRGYLGAVYEMEKAGIVISDKKIRDKITALERIVSVKAHELH